jgi:hypothetical protein
MSVVGRSRDIAPRSLTVAFGAKRTFGGRPPRRIYEFAAREATFEPNLNAHIFDLDGAPPIQSRRRASQSLGEASGLLFRLFSPDARHVKSCEQNRCFWAARLGNEALQRNRRTSVFLMALGKHPVGRPSVPFLGRLAVGTDLPAGPGCSNDGRQP